MDGASYGRMRVELNRNLGGDFNPSSLFRLINYLQFRNKENHDLTSADRSSLKSAKLFLPTIPKRKLPRALFWTTASGFSAVPNQRVTAIARERARRRFPQE